MKEQFQGSYIKGNVNTLLTCHTFAFLMSWSKLYVHDCTISPYRYIKIYIRPNGFRSKWIKEAWIPTNDNIQGIDQSSKMYFVYIIYIHKCDLDINVICSFVDLNYPILRLFLSSITWTILFIFSQFQRKAHCI